MKKSVVIAILALFAAFGAVAGFCNDTQLNTPLQKAIELSEQNSGDTSAAGDLEAVAPFRNSDHTGCVMRSEELLRSPALQQRGNSYRLPIFRLAAGAFALAFQLSLETPPSGHFTPVTDQYPQVLAWLGCSVEVRAGPFA